MKNLSQQEFDSLVQAFAEKAKAQGIPLVKVQVETLVAAAICKECAGAGPQARCGGGEEMAFSA